MAHLLAIVPSLDATIRQYVEEGLGSFQRGSFLSAAVMLGAASEKEIYLLGGSLLVALKDPVAQAQLTKLANGRSLYRLLECIDKHLASHKKHQDIFDGAEIHVMSLFESIRVQRNDAVHPNILLNVGAEIIPVQGIELRGYSIRTDLPQHEVILRMLDEHHAKQKSSQADNF